MKLFLKPGRYSISTALLFVILFLVPAALVVAQDNGGGIVPPEGKPFIVVIDPGHGGFDPGARGRYSTEKQIALQVSLKVGKLIDKIPNVKVVYTRTTDQLPGGMTSKTAGLHYRADFANKVGGNVFISIHCNSARSRSARGTEVYVWGLTKNEDKDLALRENAPLLNDPEYKALFDSSGSVVNTIFWNAVRREYMRQSLALAGDVEKQFAKINRIDRSVKQRGVGIWVLHATAMPSVLIETGFISNPEEERYLNNNQDEIAECIYKAFVNYLADIRGLTSEEILQGKTAAGQDQNEIYSYKIQLLVSNSRYDTDSKRFDKLEDPVTRKEINVNKDKMYRYLLGDYKSYEEVSQKLERVKLMGYRDAFIVTYKNDKRIDP